MSEPKRTRVAFLGFAEEMVATNVLELIKGGIAAKEIVVEDWAMVHKAVGGKLTVTTDKSKDPGAVRGGLFGGGAGMILAAISGPIGAGAVVAGAAIGAVGAAMKDSGFKDHDIKEVSTLMADGRTGIMVGIPLDDAPAWDEFVANHVEFEASDNRHQVDIVPGNTFEDALEHYRQHEED
jgi:uncharacterized membrane protein